MPREDNINLMMNVAGNFKGVAVLLRNKEISQEEAANLRAYAFKRIKVKVGEIRNEIVKLQAVVQTLETICLRILSGRRPCESHETSDDA